MPDIYLRSVPSDANNGDVRLYDPTQADASSGSIFIPALLYRAQQFEDFSSYQPLAFKLIVSVNNPPSRINRQVSGDLEDKQYPRYINKIVSGVDNPPPARSYIFRVFEQDFQFPLRVATYIPSAIPAVVNNPPATTAFGGNRYNEDFQFAIYKNGYIFVTIPDAPVDAPMLSGGFLHHSAKDKPKIIINFLEDEEIILL